jgi:hypothetical protein
MARARKFPHLITARASPTPTAHALDILLLLQLRLGDAADARCAEVGFFGLDAAEAAELMTS